MSRPNRLDLPGVPQHIVQRGVNRSPSFMREIHYLAYLQLLGEYATRLDCDIHAYVLMTNHVHLLVTPHTKGGVGRLMQALGRKYVSFVNYTMGRTGTLWEGRYKSCLVGSAQYVLACYRYIEFNPVRAGMVSSPGQYRWSSYAANAIGRTNPLITPHAAYSSLAHAVDARCEAYLDWVRSREFHHDEASIRLLTSRQRAFGDDDFRAELEKEHLRPMGPLKDGRPRKSRAVAIRKPELRL